MSNVAVIARFFEPFDQGQNSGVTPAAHSASKKYEQRNKRVSMDLGSQGTLSFHNITYVVNEQGHCRCLPWRKTKSDKLVIDKLSGLFGTGMNAVMGPTGCGKSSLLDILADRKDPAGLSGRVLIDGQPPPPSYKYIVGYVVQDDCISGTLTVRENLMFSARVRLPDEISNDERRERVTSVIRDLSLETCADTRIGTEFLRGVSGGERKRTCIGMELVLSPKILFLDEPTTGLDASTARNVMECLKKLSRTGRTIVFSIHQPRYSIFQLFDTVLLMCQGKGVYHGGAAAMLPYFNSLNHHCDLHDNPADFALDVLIDARRQPVILDQLHQAYLHSDMYAAARSVLQGAPRTGEHQRLHRVGRSAAARTLGVEIFYVAQRTLRNSLRNPSLFLSQIVVAIILGLLAGLVFYDMERTIDAGVENRLGAICFIVVSQVFSTVTAIEPLAKERVLFIHEHVSGYYRISTFFLAKLVCDIIPMRICPSVLFSSISYFMMGLQRTAGHFFVFLATVFMASVFGAALCFFVSASIPIFGVAFIVVVLIIVVMFVFSGFLIELTSVVRWLSWIQWISALRYASNVLTVNEFRGIRFCLANASSICPLSGEDVLGKKQLDYQSDWAMWKYFFALSSMAIVFLLFAFIQLFRIKKRK